MLGRKESSRNDNEDHEGNYEYDFNHDHNVADSKITSSMMIALSMTARSTRGVSGTTDGWLHTNDFCDEADAFPRGTF
jgi:hypothetical protein